MYSPKISEQLIPVIYRRAKTENRPMTQVVNEALTDFFLLRYYCQSCNNEILIEEKSDKGFCEHCESEVFLRAAKQ